MPPKRGKAKATPAKVEAAPEPPATVTTNRGREIETTAATARPRRGTIVDATPMPQKATATKAKAAPEASSPTKRGRGRPTKSKPEEEELEELAEPPKKRGRPAKAVVDEPEEDAEAPKRRGRPTKAKAVVEEPEEMVEPPKRRGRPSKATVEDPEEDIEPPKRRGRPAKAKVEEAVAAPSKKRGRPAKEKAEEPEEDAEPPKKRGRKGKDAEPVAAAAAETPKRRGRPSKAKATPTVLDDDLPTPRRRGRPSKGGETTKLDEDDEAAAEQLEDELLDAAPTTRKRKPSTTTAKKGKTAKTTKASDDEDVEDAEPADAAVEDSGKQYWLMKAEQEDREETASDGSTVNTKFTIDDLRANNGPELWDGVRNASAAKNMRAMKLGDLAFFYASGGKQGRAPGITGVMEIVSEAEPDATAAQKGSLYYVADEKKRENWCVVGVEFRKKLTTPVKLKELQKYGDKGALGGMQLFTQSRLSVSKVSEKQWDFIIDNLIEGYEEDGGASKDVAAAEEMEPQAATGAEAGDTEMKDAEPPNGIETADFAQTDDLAAAEEDAGLPDTTTMPGGLPELALPSVESDLLTTDTMLPSATAETSRPASRAASRAPSHAPSRASARSRAGSRAPSAAPSVHATTEKTLSSLPASRAGSLVPSVSAHATTEKVSSSRPASRAGSLAPSVSARPSSRGRSRTPKPRAGSVQPVHMGTLAEEEDKAMDAIAE